MYNFKQLKHITAGIAQRSKDADYKDNYVGHYLNLSLQGLYNSYDYWPECRDAHDFTTVDGTALYYMPKRFDKPFRAYDITNDKKLIIKTEEEYYDANQANINDTTESDADTIYLKEVVGVQRQVSTSGDTVQAKSSAAESPSVIVRVEGYLDSSLTIIGYENITVPSTAYVAGTTTFYKITHVSKYVNASANSQGVTDNFLDSNGYITLADSSSNVLGVLDRNENVLRHKAFRLGLVPDDSTTSIRLLFKKKMRRMTNDYDYPFVECDDYLIYDAAAMSISQSKEGLDYASDLRQRASMAKSQILTNVQGIMGPDYQHKITSSSLRAHRR